MYKELLTQVLSVALGASALTTLTVQKIKEGIKIKNSKNLVWISLAVSMIFGTSFSLIFSDLNIMYSLAVGFITWLGADTLYKSLEDKFPKWFSSLKELDESITITKEDFK